MEEGVSIFTRKFDDGNRSLFLGGAFVQCTMRSLFSRMPLYPIFLGVFLESGLGPFIKAVR